MTCSFYDCYINKESDSGCSHVAGYRSFFFITFLISPLLPCFHPRDHMCNFIDSICQRPFKTGQKMGSVAFSLLFWRPTLVSYFLEWWRFQKQVKIWLYNCGNGKQKVKKVLSNIYKPLPTHPLEMGKGKLYHAFADVIGRKVESFPQIANL